MEDDAPRVAVRDAAAAVECAFDGVWADEVCRRCDPVFEAAGVGFTRQVGYDPDGGVSTILWEADPSMFAEKYPDSGIVETYGEQWDDVPCIDWWVYVEAERQQCRVSVEGWSLPDLRLDLTGAMDGFALADLFARLLAVPSPRVVAG